MSYRQSGVYAEGMKARQRYITALLLVSLLSVSLGIFAQPTPTATPATQPETQESQEEKPLKVSFLDVRHGDACLIQCPNGQNILIDAGSRSYASRVIGYLQGEGVRELDLVIATHPHTDHIGGLSDVLEEIPAKMVLDSGKTHTTAGYRRFIKATKENPDVDYRLGRAGQVYEFGDVKLRILHPGEQLPGNMNDCSIVCRLEYGNISMLFTGDASKQAESQIIRRRYPLRSTVLKVGHHGSSSSTTRPFLSAVSPRVAVVSSSAGSSKNYHAKVLGRLEASGAKVYKTVDHGTVIIESTGNDCQIKRIRKWEHPERIYW